ncbi:MAG: adenylate/guanylate cyclase domain-containing protein [Desulfobacterales bacterium]|nr:adenylate/guanylate cyclase domain-containing protein [Desulfobacterales bacterium]
MKISKRFKQTQWTIFGAGFCITCLFAGLYVFKPAYLHLLELKLYDTFLQQVHTPPENPAVAVVDIDEYSIKKFGQWPWPRYRVGLLLEKILAAGALAVGNDILYGEPDGSSPRIIQSLLKRDLNVNMGFTGLPEQLMDNDRLLADILAQGPFALAYTFYFQQGDIGAGPEVRLPPFKAVVVKEPGAGDIAQYLQQAEQVIPPLPELMASKVNAGYMNTGFDPDGVLRSVPLLIAWKGKLYPHISLATLMTALKGKVANPMVKVSSGGISSIRIGSTVVPLDARGRMMVNYKGPGYTFPFVPAAHVLEGRGELEKLNGKVVFLGSSAAGLMDIRVSPLDAIFPGVEVNATIVDNILKEDFIHRPDWVPGLEFVAILLWGMITTVFIGWTSAWLTLPVTLGLAAGAFAGGLTALKEYHIWISPFFPLLVLCGNFAFLTLFKFWFSERKKKFYRSAFSRYVSKAVVDQISDSPETMNLEGEEKEMTIMFTDIRSFTTISESLSPTQVTNLLHDYLTPMTRSVIKNRGTLDKFIGDAVMCFWNAPLDIEGHPKLAVQTGFEMLDALKGLNRIFIDKYGIEIDIGIGVHTGKCRVGNMGSTDLFDYTLIGDNVNLTSRLEGLTKFYGVRLIVSGTLKTMLEGEYLFQELDQVRVKGKTEPVGIFTVFPKQSGEDQELAEELAAYERGLACYKEMAFEQGLGIFNDLAERYPDTRIHRIYRERCTIFMDDPPDPGWDGVFVHNTK